MREQWGGSAGQQVTKGHVFALAAPALKITKEKKNNKDYKGHQNAFGGHGYYLDCGGTHIKMQQMVQFNYV